MGNGVEPRRSSLGSLCDEKDYSSKLSALMETQHSMLQKVHGVDSPQVALSTSLLSLQSTVRNFHHGQSTLSKATLILQQP